MSSSLPIPNVSTILNLEGEQNDRRKIEKLQTNYASFEKETRAYLTGNHQDDTNFQGEISGTHIPFLKSIEERINSANGDGDRLVFDGKYELETKRTTLEGIANPTRKDLFNLESEINLRDNLLKAFEVYTAKNNELLARLKELSQIFEKEGENGEVNEVLKNAPKILGDIGNLGSLSDLDVSTKLGELKLRCENVVAYLARKDFQKKLEDYQSAKKDFVDKYPYLRNKLLFVRNRIDSNAEATGKMLQELWRRTVYRAHLEAVLKVMKELRTKENERRARTYKSLISLPKAAREDLAFEMPLNIDHVMNLLNEERLLDLNGANGLDIAPFPVDSELKKIYDRLGEKLKEANATHEQAIDKHELEVQIKEKQDKIAELRRKVEAIRNGENFPIEYPRFSRPAPPA
eukprot:TRINITY_DN715_c0_g1_i2.p1 TRINITY_DN715_c0_g1~~TRINITY_DN715_c0_g1_i2.p1  ORF type:complete len:405 (+),score=71.11 TRINITY_DN715_c0_g1_i2:173-1387(+)